MDILKAIDSRDIKNVKQAITDGESVNCTNDEWYSPLEAACLYGDRYALDIIKLLVESGADVNYQRSESGETPLSWTATNGTAEIVDYLISKGANVEGNDNIFYTPFLNAVCENNVDTMNALAKHGANIHAKAQHPHDKQSALDFATHYKFKRAEKRLIEMFDGHIEPIKYPVRPIEDIIKDLDQLMVKDRPDVYESLNPPATQEDFKALEELLELPLPDNFKKLYQWHNGCTDDDYDIFHVITRDTFMSIDMILEHIEESNGLLESGDITKDIWQIDWLPFMTDYGNDICIDLSKEYYGKIISHNHEGNSGCVKFNSLNEWLEDLVEEIKDFDYSRLDDDEDY